jgi:hypothetical protein
MMQPRNRVVQVSRFGDPEGLEVVDAPLPTAGRGEVRVRVLASSLNYTEVLIRCHLYPQTMRLRPPFVMGYDVVGEIDQLGDGVRDYQIGDRVADMTVVRSNADYRTLRADDVARVPLGVDAAEAHCRRYWRRRLSPFVRGAQARRSALRHRLLGELAGTAAHAPYHDGACAPVPVEAVARRQACPLLFSQCDPGATSHLVQGGLGAAIRPIGNACHPAAHCRADLL